MHFPKQMLLNNVAWADEALYGDPQLFERLRCGQTPRVLWIGCADSRVPAEIITGARPGELFVHRNIANLFLPHDDNTMSVVEYAVSVLEVKDIVICGHYGCGGVQASLGAVREDLPHVEQRIQALRRLAAQHEDELGTIADIGERTNRLVEISVMEQARLVGAAPVVRDAVPRPSVHAWVFDIGNGLIRTLPCGPVGERGDQGSHAAGGAKVVYGRSPACCEASPACEAADV
jgi:carbonic anhydrase